MKKKTLFIETYGKRKHSQLLGYPSVNFTAISITKDEDGIFEKLEKYETIWRTEEIVFE